MDRKEQLLQLLLAVAHRLVALKKTTMAHAGCDSITVAGLEYAEAIARYESVTMAELSKAMGLSKPSISTMVAKLMDAGWVRKERSPDDGRVFIVTLTEQGRALVARHQAAFAAFADQVANKLTPSEFDALVALLAKAV